MARSILMFALAAALLAAAVSCDGSKTAPASQPSAQAPVEVRAVALGHDPFPEFVDFTGTLYGDEEAQIASKASGRIVEIAADMGDRLDEGALIARVDPTDYDLAIRQRESALNEALSKIGLQQLPPEDFDVTTVATVRRAKVQADNAKARLDRAKQLFDQPSPLISPQEYADTETQYAVAQQDFDVAVLEVKGYLATAQSRAADLVAARQQLADTRIVAPQSGPTSRPARWAVAERHTSVGEYVTAGTVVYKLIADQPIKLRAAIPERYLNRITTGQTVALYVDSSGQPTAGEVSRVSPAVDVASRTFMVEVTFANADRKLKAGSFGRGTITVGTRTDVTTLPAPALYSFAGLDKVFTIQDGKAVSHTVNVLSRGKDKVVVETDLGGAKEAAVGGFARLATGVQVHVKRE